MRAPLRTLLAVIWVACVAGAIVIFALTFGVMSWKAFAVAGLLGLVIGIPGGLWTARQIKREDPSWPPART